MKLANNDKRRVTINKYQGKWLVNVREYYEDKAGDLKPGKKVKAVHIPATMSDLPLTQSQGISLTVEQYQSLVGIVPAINQQLRKNGVALDGDVIEDDVEDEDEDEDEKPAKATKKSKKTKVESKKANIEATSDEDDDE